MQRIHKLTQDPYRNKSSFNGLINFKRGDNTIVRDLAPENFLCLKASKNRACAYKQPNSHKLILQKWYDLEFKGRKIYKPKGDSQVVLKKNYHLFALIVTPVSLVEKLVLLA